MTPAMRPSGGPSGGWSHMGRRLALPAFFVGPEQRIRHVGVIAWHRVFVNRPEILEPELGAQAQDAPEPDHVVALDRDVLRILLDQHAVDVLEAVGDHVEPRGARKVPPHQNRRETRAVAVSSTAKPSETASRIMPGASWACPSARTRCAGPRAGRASCPCACSPPPGRARPGW